MKAKDIMVCDVPSVSVRTTVAEAVAMLKENFGDESFMNAAPGLIVLNERGALAGILTPLSIITALMEGVPVGQRPEDEMCCASMCDKIKSVPVSEIMEHQPISVTEDANIFEIADLFLKHRFQRVPVVSGKRVVGIIYRSRLLFAMTRSLEQPKA
jgi:CBS domain-containing protein